LIDLIIAAVAANLLLFPTSFLVLSLRFLNSEPKQPWQEWCFLLEIGSPGFYSSQLSLIMSSNID